MTKDEIVEGEIMDETSIAIHEQQMMKPELIDTETIIANIKAEKEIREALTKHLMEALVPKTDYYTVRKGGKNSLGKSGAEKVCFMFNLVPKYVILEKTVNKERAEYEMRCDMYNKITGKFAGSGVGSATSKEDKVVASMAKQGIKNVESVANNMLKIAKKRAYVDATLSSTMISFMFTQDLEDGYVGYDNSSAPKKTYKGDPKNMTAQGAFDWSKLDLSKTASEKMRNRLFAIRKRLDITDGEFKLATTNLTKKEHSKEWTYGDVKAIDEWLIDYESQPEGLSPEEQAEADKI